MNTTSCDPSMMVQKLPEALLEQMAEVLRVLAHADRLRLLETLDRLGPAPVHQLIEELGLPQATTSQHLNRMRRAGVVSAERRGREVWYGIRDPNSLTILNCIRKRGDTA